MYAGNWNILVPAGKENKLVMPLLAASEKGTGQTESSFEKEIEMWWAMVLSWLVKVFWKEVP
jgi:hypothetical protein